MSPPDRTDPSDRPTWRPPVPPGTPPCTSLFCGDISLPGFDRCARHIHTSPTLRMRTDLLEAYLDACRPEAAE